MSAHVERGGEAAGGAVAVFDALEELPRAKDLEPGDALALPGDAHLSPCSIDEAADLAAVVVEVDSVAVRVVDGGEARGRRGWLGDVGREDAGEARVEAVDAIDADLVA